jgi:hypothetical protein
VQLVPLQEQTLAWQAHVPVVSQLTLQVPPVQVHELESLQVSAQLTPL